MVAINQRLPYKLFSSPSDIEVITITIGLNSPVTLCTVYNPPNSSTESQKVILDYLTSLAQTDNLLLIVGDFNIADVNWSLLSGSTHFSNQMCDFVFDWNLSQLIESPTHIKGNILDLLMTNHNDSIKNLTILPHDQSSNIVPSVHCLITFDTRLYTDRRFTNSTSSCALVFDFPRADLDGLCSYPLDHDFSSCIQSNNVNTVWLRRKEAIMTGMNLFVPKVRLRRNQQPKWFTSYIRHHLNCTKTLRKECKLHPTLSKLSKLSSSEANLRSELAYAKSNYETKLIQQFAYTNNSKIYRYISSLSKSSAGPPCVHLDAEAAVSDQKKACLYNRYFHSVFTSSGLTDPVTSITPIQPSISSIPITTSDVYTALATLDPTKFMGIDGIGPRVLNSVRFHSHNHYASFSAYH